METDWSGRRDLNPRPQRPERCSSDSREGTGVLRSLGRLDSPGDSRLLCLTGKQLGTPILGERANSVPTLGRLVQCALRSMPG